MLKKIILLSLLSLPFLSHAEEEGIGKIQNEKLTLEVVRQKVDVKMVITSENIKRYESIAIERAEFVEGPYRQVKFFMKDRINKSTDNSILDYDNYPLAVKHGGFYRVRTEEANGVMRIFPGVQLIGILQEAQMSAGNFTETKTGSKNALASNNSNARTKNSSSATRDVVEITQGMTVDGEKNIDIFDKYANTETLTASVDNTSIPINTGSYTKKFKAKDSKDIIETTGSAIAIEDSRDTDEPMFSAKNANGEGVYTEYVLTGLTQENVSSPAYRNFMKENLVKSNDITFEVGIENGSIGSEIKLDKTEKYFEIIIEYTDNKEEGYSPFKKFGSSYISDKFVNNRYTIIEPFFAPKSKKTLYFRMRLKEFDGDEYVTKSTKITFP